MIRFLQTISLVLIFTSYGWSQSETVSSLHEIQSVSNADKNSIIEPVSLDSNRLAKVMKEVSGGVVFTFEETWKNAVLENKPKDLNMELMAPTGELIQVKLERIKGALDNASIVLASSGKLVNVPNSVHYKGSITDKPDSKVGVSILESEVMGVFSWGGASYTLGKLKTNPKTENAHIFYKNNNLLLDFPDLCHVTADHDLSEKSPSSSKSSNTDNCVHMYFEVTHDIFLDKGDLPSTLDYINGALSQVKILFDNEEINWEVQEILVWDTPDPYDGPGSGDYLNQFRNELNGNYNGDLAHLLGYGGGGGVAYLDVLCNNYWGVAYSGIGSSYNDVPEYSWTIMVISHEIGHNIGSPHTHACAWNGDDTMIDGCGPEAGYPQNPSCPVGPLPPSGGTVMSYCHLIGGTGIDLGEGFHPQVADLFEDEVDNASCLGPCESFIPTADFGVVSTNLCEGTSVQFYSLSSDNATEWDWSFPGGSPSSSTDEHPEVTYNTPGTYDVTLEVTSNAGITDELVISGYILVDNNGSEILVYQDFENGLGDYIIDNSGGPGFETTDVTSGSTYGESVLQLDNFNNNGGDVDDLLSPNFSLLAYNSATLYIDYAVTRKNNVSDSLVIYASKDGGATFEWVAGFFENGNETYSTHLNTNSPFIPETAEDWCLELPGNGCLAIDLGAFTREDDVQFRIRNKYFGGNNLYIDRLWVETDCYDLDSPVADFSASPDEGCVALVVDFTDLSTEFPQSHDWIFDGGLPSTSSEANPTVVYDEPGEYAVTLSVTNPEGADTETKINYIVVGDVPTAEFDSDIVDRTVSLSYTGMRGDSFEWDFGDGNSSSEENPTHTYAEDGIYTVTLTATNDCGTASTQMEIEIATLPVASVDVSTTGGCEPLEVFYDATGSTNVDSVYWEFEGGNPTNSNQDTATVVYNEEGTFDLFFVAMNENGNDTIFLEDHIAVEALPYAEFSTGIDDLTVIFYNLSEFYDDVFWDFGDGETSSSNSPEHTYDEIGIYEVELVATNSCGTDTFSLELDLFAPIQISFSGNTVSGCAEHEVQFSNSTQNADSFQWTFEGGNPATSNESEPLVVYETVGTFDVELIASNDNFSDTLLFENYIEVIGAPQAGFTSAVNHPEIEFTNTSTGASSFLWNFGDGNSSNTENPIHSYVNEGTYLVELMAMNICDTAIFLEEVEYYSTPEANFSSTINEGCAPLTVTYDNLSSPNSVNFEWSFPGGEPSTSTEENPEVSYTEFGTYSAILRVENPAGRDTLELTNLIEVYPLPEPAFDYIVDSLTLSFSNESFHADSYYWEFGDGSIDTTANPVHTYGSDSSYIVTLYAINSCDTISLSREVGTEGLPRARFQIVGDRLGCVPFSIEFENLTEGFVSEYEWIFPGGTPDSSQSETPTVTYDSAGVYSITLIAHNPNGSNQFTLQNAIRVIDVPTADFAVVEDSDLGYLFESEIEGEDITEILWDFGDGNQSNELNPKHVFAGSGLYNVVLTVSNICGTDTISKEIEITSTSIEPFSDQTMQVYPNPAQDRVYISPWPSKAQIEIHNSLGSIVMRQGARNSNQFLLVDRFSPGMYFIHIIRRDGRLVFPLVIQR